MARQNVNSFVWGITALKKDNYYYFGIPKNGVLTHKHFFKERGWEETPVWNVRDISTDVTIIAHIRNPVERYIRGIVQSLIGKGKDISFLEKMNDNPTFLSFVLTSVNDIHTAPISPMIPSSISPYQINWIPMDHPKWSSNFLLNQLFREINLPYVITENDIDHKASPEIKKMQDFIREKILHPDKEFEQSFGTFRNAVLSEDENIYKHVMRQYSVREHYYTEIFKTK